MAEAILYPGKGPAKRAVVVGLCFAIALLEGFDIQAIGVAAPKMFPALGLDPAQTGLVFGGGMAGLVAGAAVGGWLADQISRKAILILSALMFGVFTLATTVVDDFGLLLAVRILTGLGLGAAMPSLVTTALDISLPERRTRTVTTMFCGLPLGGAGAAFAATQLLDTHGWKSLFLIGGALPLVVLPLILLAFPRMPPVRAVSGATVSAPATLFGGGRAGMTLLLWVTFGATLLVLYLLLNWLPSLVTAKGLAPQVGAWAALTFNAGSVAGALTLGALVDRLGPRRPIFVAYLVLLGAMAGLAAATDVVAVLACAALTGFCLLGAQFSLYGIAPMYYPAAGRGLATGAAVAAGRLGSIAGPLVAGQLMAYGLTGAGVTAAMLPVLAVAGIAGVALTWVGRPQPA